MKTLSQFVGLKEFETDFNVYYGAIIDKLGGPDAIRPYIPFSDEDLEKSLAEDEHFNTKLTPIHSWDRATGITYQNGKRIQTAPPSGLLPLLVAHGITHVSQASCVCILKEAARRYLYEKRG